MTHIFHRKRYTIRAVEEKSERVLFAAKLYVMLY